MSCYLSEYFDSIVVERRKTYGSAKNRSISERTSSGKTDYTEVIRKEIVKRMHFLFIGGCIAFLFYLTVLFLEPEHTSELFDFVKGMSLGISFGMVIVGTIMTSKYADRIVQWKVKHNIISDK